MAKAESLVYVGDEVCKKAGKSGPARNLQVAPPDWLGVPNPDQLFSSALSVREEVM